MEKFNPGSTRSADRDIDVDERTVRLHTANSLPKLTMQIQSQNDVQSIKETLCVRDDQTILAFMSVKRLEDMPSRLVRQQVATQQISQSFLAVIALLHNCINQAL